MQIGRTQNGIEVIAIDRPIEQVVSFSAASSPAIAPVLQMHLLASLTAAMLDQGTQKQDRFQIAETLIVWVRRYSSQPIAIMFVSQAVFCVSVQARSSICWPSNLATCIFSSCI